MPFTLLVAMAVATQGAPRTISPNFLPMTIRRAVDEANTMCKESGGKPGPSSKLIKFADLTGDGVTDYVMDLAYYQCDGAASALGAGQSGSAISIFVGGPNNTATKVYDAVTQGVELVSTAGKPELHVAVMGAECGQRNAQRLPMSDVAVCLRPLHWNTAKRAFVLGPLSEKRPFSVQ